MNWRWSLFNKFSVWHIAVPMAGQDLRYLTKCGRKVTSANPETQLSVPVDKPLCETCVKISEKESRP